MAIPLLKCCGEPMSCAEFTIHCPKCGRYEEGPEDNELLDAIAPAWRALTDAQREAVYTELHDWEAGEAAYEALKALMAMDDD